MRSKKEIMLALSMALCANLNLAYGYIPVIDATSLKQSAMQSVKELAEMAKQLVEAKNQLVELKNQVNAMTGIKGFSDIMKLGGLDEELIGSFDDLLNGNTSSLLSKSKDYVEKAPSCDNSKNKEFCTSSLLNGVALLDQVEKVNDQIGKKLETLTKLSEKAQSATDVKSMAELQANISLEANSIALLQQQISNFERLQKAQEEVYRMQRHEESNKMRWKLIEEDFNRPKFNNANSSRYFN